VVCAPVSTVKIEEIADVDLLVLGTYTHGGHTNQRLLRLCDTLPRHQFERTAVAVFGTQMTETLEANQPGGVDDLAAHLEARGFDIAVPPLRFGLPGAAAFLPNRGIEEHEAETIRGFARDLLEACVSAPFG
jgi:hypothetical protein